MQLSESFEFSKADNKNRFSQKQKTAKRGVNSTSLSCSHGKPGLVVVGRNVRKSSNRSALVGKGSVETEQRFIPASWTHLRLFTFSSHCSYSVPVPAGSRIADYGPGSFGSTTVKHILTRLSSQPHSIALQ
jgi:hypothetical protein